MGVNLGKIIEGKEIELSSLSGKKIAIDAFNAIFQFLSIIRDKETGEPLKDSKGRITSHLSGIFYRTANLIEFGIKPIFVFDGEPPDFKKKTIEKREKMRLEAERKMKEAIEKGEEFFKYAQATARINEEIIEDSKKLLNYMGVPWIQAPSEGEAQCSFMCKNGDVDFSASQDYDSLLFGSPHLVRNLTISGRKKRPNVNIFYEVMPEVINLDEVLKELEITREQLIILGMLVGTDYNIGVKGIGPKKALKYVKENKNLESIINGLSWTEDVDINEVFDFFMNPIVTEDYNIEWKKPDVDKIIKFMVDEHNFSQERVEKTIDKLESGYIKSSQKTLGKWFVK
jgi:flap endonuclease-1